MPSIAKFDQWQDTAGNMQQTILQVKQTYLTTRYSQSVTTTWNDLTDFNVSITPKSTSSKFLVMVRWFGEYGTADSVYNSVWGLKRNGTLIGNQTDMSTATGITAAKLSYEGTDAASTPETVDYWYLDSPNTISPLTYQVSMWNNASITLFTNRVASTANLNTNGYETGTSGILVMEVAA